MKMYVVYSLEVPWQGTSNKYYNIGFCDEIKKKYVQFGWKKKLSYLESAGFSET